MVTDQWINSRGIGIKVHKWLQSCGPNYSLVSSLSIVIRLDSAHINGVFNYNFFFFFMGVFNYNWFVKSHERQLSVEHIIWSPCFLLLLFLFVNFIHVTVKVGSWNPKSYSHIIERKCRLKLNFYVLFTLPFYKIGDNYWTCSLTIYHGLKYDFNSNFPLEVQNPSIIYKKKKGKLRSTLASILCFTNFKVAAWLWPELHMQCNFIMISLKENI